MLWALLAVERGRGGNERDSSVLPVSVSLLRASKGTQTVRGVKQQAQGGLFDAFVGVRL